MKSKYALRFLALGYLALLLGIPVALVFINAFQDGIGAAWDAVTTPEAQHAFYLTMVMVAVAVPLNTIFGVLCALAVVRQRFRGRALLNAARRPAVRRLAGGRRASRCCSSTGAATAGSASGSRSAASRSSSRRRA